MGLDVQNSLGVSCIAANARRNAGVLHRSAITSTDVLAVPVTAAGTAVTEAGSNLANSNMKFTASAGNRWGVSTGAAVRNVTPLANQAINVPIAIVTGADYYDVFLSTDAAPLWVGRITEAQRLAGGFIISTVGTVTAGGSAPANSVDIGIVGTGVAWNVSPFDVNNAYRPDSVTAIDCTGFATAYILAKLAMTDTRSLPTCKLAVFLGNKLSTADFHLVSVLDMAPLSAVGKPLEQALTVTLNGASGLAVVVHTISGTGAALSAWVELA